MNGAYNSVCKSRLKKLSGSGHELVIMKEKNGSTFFKTWSILQKRAVVFSFYTTCFNPKAKAYRLPNRDGKLFVHFENNRNSFAVDFWTKTRENSSKIIVGNAIFLARAIFSVQDYYLNHKDSKEKLKGSIDRKFHSDVFEKCI